jgi:hypothetical protein
MKEKERPPQFLSLLALLSAYLLQSGVILWRTAKVMQWDPIILICVYRLFVVVACCITYVVFYKRNGRTFLWMKPINSVDLTPEPFI